MSDIQTDEAGNSVPLGVNVLGDLQGDGGLSVAARSTIRTLQAAGIEFTVNGLRPLVSRYRNGKPSGDHRSENPFPINIVHLNPPSIFRLPEKLKLEYFRHRYNIGVWLWETLDLPREWYPAFDEFDEIWTPSSFCQESISLASPIPVVKVPISIDLPTPTIDRTRLGLPVDRFLFLFVFDFESSSRRKNPLATIEAFLEAFGRSDDGPMLIVKSAHSEVEPSALEHMKKFADNAPNIRFSDELIDRDQVEALIYNCDCYVSLHRAEGFGLTIAEAMYFGKPVIATGYSANMEFMTPDNSFPVRYELKPMHENVDDASPYSQGGMWAEASVPHAAELMRYVIENKDGAERVGRIAAADIRRDHGPAAAAEILALRIEQIGRRIKEPSSDSTGHSKRETDLALIHVKGFAERIAQMERSRFWRARNAWFALGRRLGFTDQK